MFIVGLRDFSCLKIDREKKEDRFIEIMYL